MICSNCGTQFEGKFCPDCGTPAELPAQEATPTPVDAAPIPESPAAQQPAFAAQPAQQPASAAQPAAAGAYAAPVGSLGNPNGSALDVVRRIAGSKLFLISAILVAAAMLLTLIRGLAYPSVVKTTVTTTTISGGKTITEEHETESPASAILACIPTALLLLGILLTYFGARKPEKPMPTSGLTIIKVMEIITMVLVILGAFVLLICGILLLIGAENAKDLLKEIDLENREGFEKFMDWLNEHSSHERSAAEAAEFILRIIAVVCFVFTGILAFAAVAVGRLLHTINVVKKTIQTGAPNSRISGFFAGLCCVFGVLCALGVIGLANGDGKSVFSAITALCSGAAYFCFGLLQFQYRKQMRALEQPK